MLQRRLRAFTLVELLVVITIIGILIALLLPAVQAAREAARRMQCSNNLKQIGLAMHNYHAAHSSFPPGGGWADLVNGPDGNPIGTQMGLHVYLLPYLELNNIYDRLDHTISICEGINLQLEKDVPQVYLCPSDGKQPLDPHMEETYQWRTTNYVGVMGSGLVSVHKTADSFCGDFYTDGVFYPYSRTRVTDIKDGSSNTLALGERIEWIRVWTSGAYYYGSPESQVCVFSSKNIRWPINTDRDVICYKLCPGPRTCSFNDVFFGSRHPGGAQFCLGDGSVHFISETIDFQVYQSLGTIDGGEVTDWSP